jgi:hypothetical protein
MKLLSLSRPDPSQDCPYTLSNGALALATLLQQKSPYSEINNYGLLDSSAQDVSVQGRFSERIFQRKDMTCPLQ